MTDKTGNVPSYYPDSYSGWVGQEVGKWINDVINTNENETDINGRPTINAIVKKIGGAILNNIEFSAGIGLGYYAEANVLDTLGLGVGMYGNLFAVNCTDGVWDTGNEMYSGITLSTAAYELGAAEQIVGKGYDTESPKSWAGINPYKETVTILSAAAYAGIGASIYVGFDTITFCQDIDRIFTY